MVMGILFCLVAVAALTYGAKTVLEAQAMQEWPTCRGVIIKSETRWQRGTDGGSSTLIADVQYRYEVEGRTYQGDSISQGQYGSNDPAHARQEAGQYPLGSLVDVHYDPDDPQHSFLETNWHWLNAIALVVGSIALIAGLFLIRQSTRLKL